MKKLVSILIVFALFSSATANAQFRNLDKKIEQKVKRRAERKVDQAIDKALDKTEKGAEDAVKGDKKTKNKTGNESAENEPDDKPSEEGSTESADKKSFQAYTKFDFIPGEKVIFYDDFQLDNPGDFPAKWNTNGSGEIVAADEGTKWFELKGNSVYIPLINKPFTENYTFEFDLKTSELDQKLSSTSYIHIVLDDNEAFNPGKNFVRIRLPYCQYNPGNIQVENRIGGKEMINNNLIEDTRKKMKEGTHISVAVNKRRFRLWMDEQKIIDIPTLVPENIKNIKFSMQGFNEDFKNYHFYIGNLKVAEGKSDLRSMLITEGKFVTNGILFDTNSDKIKSESYGILKEIAQVLKDNESIHVKVTGHTDSDGDEKNNLDLSKRRAASVKSALVKEFGIEEARLESDGKGETEPADKNDSSEGKANNRRVEFVKL